MNYTYPMDDQQMTPKGAEIPVPKRDEWEKVLRKAAHPKPKPKPKPKGSTTDRPPKK